MPLHKRFMQGKKISLNLYYTLRDFIDVELDKYFTWNL
jgi:hypothetical protein